MPKEEKKKDNKLIKKKTRVSVSNTLNQMVFEQKDMNLQAFRMLMFYLAKINPKRPEFTEVKVLLTEYAEMLGVELNEQAIDKSTDMLLGYVVKLEPKQSENSKYEELSNKVQLFTQSRLLRRKSDGALMLTFKCHDELKPHIFNLQSQFTKFEVWNILNLSNFQDIRMYMLLSQYRVAGTRTLTLEELKKHLGIDKDAYPEYKEFARTVLKKCQKSLKERTDICFEFKAVGRPARSVCFEISPNTDYKILKYLDETEEAPQLPEQSQGYTYGDEKYDQTSIFDDDVSDPLANERELRAEVCEGFQDVFFDEFTLDRLKEFRELAYKHIDPDEVDSVESWMHGRREAYDYVLLNYVRSKIIMCNAKGEEIESRLGFIRKAIADNYK